MASIYVSNLIIDKGVDFSQTFNLSNNNDPKSLVGYSGTSHLRKSPSSSSYTPFHLSFIDRTNGRIQLSMTSEITSSLKSGRHVYDVLLIDSYNTKSIVIEGTVNIRSGISTGCF
jgi:hypothetical protein